MCVLKVRGKLILPCNRCMYLMLYFPFKTINIFPQYIVNIFTRCLFLYQKCRRVYLSALSAARAHANSEAVNTSLGFYKQNFSISPRVLISIWYLFCTKICLISEKWVPLQVEIKTTTTDEKLASHYQVNHICKHVLWCVVVARLITAGSYAMLRAVTWYQ